MRTLDSRKVPVGRRQLARRIGLLTRKISSAPRPGTSGRPRPVSLSDSGIVCTLGPEKVGSSESNWTTLPVSVCGTVRTGNTQTDTQPSYNRAHFLSHGADRPGDRQF